MPPALFTVSPPPPCTGNRRRVSCLQLKWGSVPRVTPVAELASHLLHPLRRPKTLEKPHPPGHFPPTPHPGAAGPSPVCPAGGAVALLIAPPGLISVTKTGPEPGRWGGGQASPPALARTQAPALTALSAPGAEQQMGEKRGGWGQGWAPISPLGADARLLPGLRSEALITYPRRRVGVRNPAPGAGKMQLSPVKFC